MSNTYYLAPRARYDLKNDTRGIPIYLRFSYKGEQAWSSTGVYVKKRDWWNDKAKLIVDGPLIQHRNRVIDKLLLEAETRLAQAILEGTGPNLNAFKGKSLISFEDYINEVDKSYSAMGVIKSIKLFQGRIENVKNIKKKVLDEIIKKLKFPEITNVTIQWLRKLQDYMEGVQGLEANSVKGYMMVLSKVMKQATKEGYITKSPIGKGLYQVPAPGKTIPTFLVEEERELVLDNLLHHRAKFKESTYMALAYFTLGCYTGLRYSDWALFDIKKHIEGEMILLRTKKTGGLVPLPKNIIRDLDSVLEVIKEVGPLNISYEQVLKELDVISGILELDKDITTHVARHSFGYMCASKGVSMEATAYAMGISVQIVKQYYHYTGKHMQDQMAKLAA